MTPLVIVLPVPPSVNELYRNAPGRGRVKTKSYVAWLEVAGPIIAAAHREAGRPVIGKPLALVVEAGFGRHRDVSGIAKATEDALVKFLPGCPDDRWNDEVTTARRDGIDPAFIVATVSSLAAPPG